jgi:AbrB family looped-hinge helix DNA binding protein
MAISRVLSRGQVTLPRDIRRKAGIKPGDVVHIEVIDRGEVRVVVLPNLGPRELRALYPIDSVIDEPADRAMWEDMEAENALGSQDG